MSLETPLKKWYFPSGNRVRFHESARVTNELEKNKIVSVKPDNEENSPLNFKLTIKAIAVTAKPANVSKESWN